MARSMVLGCCGVAWVVWGLLRGSSLAAEAASPIEALLKRPAIEPARVLFEVQTYCDARVARMPEVETVAQWEAEAGRLRRELLDRVVFRGQAAAWRDAKTRVEWLGTLGSGPGYRIRKLRYEALPGMWIPALLYEPEKLQGKVPVILNVNGHSAEGKAYVPKQIRCINQAKRGMLALNTEWLSMGQLRTPGYDHGAMNQLDLCGTSGLAPFYLCMQRALDLLLSLENADPERLAVTGLSGGGWQTISISALDPRVKLAVPVAGYSSFLTRSQHLKDLGDSEQTPSDMAALADYTHLTAMRAPRPTLLIYNAKDDCCFESGYAIGPLLAAAHPLFTLYGASHALRSHVNYKPGTHNYLQDNREALYRMLGDFFYPGDSSYPRKELPSDDEVEKPEDLLIELPENNESFNTLARKLAAKLPARGELPSSRQEAFRWQEETRRQLVEVVRAKEYKVRALERSRETVADVAVRLLQLEMGDFTVPAVVLTPKDPRRTAVLIADKGRGGAAREIQELVDAGTRVVAMDPLFFGESAPGQGERGGNKASLFALLVASVGDRPIGIQASQVAAAARWAAAESAHGPVAVVAIGPRTSVIGLMAAALEPQAIGRVELRGALGSLKQVIEDNWSARTCPELFCFGLLEKLDLKHLAALVAPRELAFDAPSDRVKQEMAELGAWYQMLGAGSALGF